MFGKRIYLFSLFGFKVNVDLSWVVLGVLITWTLASGVFPSMVENVSQTGYWVMGIAGALGLFLSIIFHEFGHSMIARRFGMEMRGITLFLFGGIAEMEDEPPNAKSEFLMAIAGPAASIILGFLFFGVNFLGRPTWPATASGVLSYLGTINLILAGFNLIPAFPLDGGRVLRAGLWAWKKDLKKATHIAYHIGNGFGTVLLVFGVFSALGGNFIGGVWYFLIGMFLKQASQMSYRQVLVRQSLEGEPVARFMVKDPVTVAPNLTVQSCVDNYIEKYHYKLYPVVDENDELQGCLTLDQIKQIPRENRESVQVKELMKACDNKNTISPDDDAMKALSRMQNHNQSRLMVTREGKLQGIIALKDMMKLLSLRMDLNENR